MSQQPLSDEEIAKLRELLDVAEVVRRGFEMRGRWRMIARAGERMGSACTKPSRSTAWCSAGAS